MRTNKWKKPNINLYNIDCMEYMKDIPNNHFELAIVDPPYGIDITNSGWVKANKNIATDNKWDKEIPTKEYFNELKRISKNQIIWGGNYFLDYLGNTRCFLIWDKQIGECTSFASSELAWTSFNKSVKTLYSHPAKYGKNKIHSTQKPVILYRWLLSNYTKPGDKIFDSHGGSMSIAIACFELGFDLDLCEIDKDYFKDGKKRFKKRIKGVSPLFIK